MHPSKKKRRNVSNYWKNSKVDTNFILKMFPDALSLRQWYNAASQKQVMAKHQYIVLKKLKI